MHDQRAEMRAAAVAAAAGVLIVESKRRWSGDVSPLPLVEK